MCICFYYLLVLISVITDVYLGARRRRELARAKNTSTSEPKRWRLKRPEDTRYGSIARVIDPNAVDESDPEMNDDARTLVETEVDAGDWAEAV